MRVCWAIGDEELAGISFDNGRIIYTGYAGEVRLLLDMADVFKNHSRVCMIKVEPHYGDTRQDGPFIEVLLNHLEPFKKTGQFGYYAIILLLVSELCKKPYPVRILRVGASSEDVFCSELSKILNEFHPKSRLCCMSDVANTPIEDNVLSLPKDLKGVELRQRQFSVLLLDDIKGEVSLEEIDRLLTALRPSGRLFCLTAREEMKEACQRALPGIEKIRAENNLWLLTKECSYQEWKSALFRTPEGRVANKKPEIALRLGILNFDMGMLEHMEDRQIRSMLHDAKELEISLVAIDHSLASTDAKLLATRFHEALIDWCLGSVTPERARACFAALQEELMRHHDIDM